MDNPIINHVSLCSGYCGIDLGLRRVLGERLRTVAYSEIEAFACELLLARMEGGQLDAAPVWTDLKRFPWEQFRGVVDILSGGYPCQPFSASGKRLGQDDPRHLWPYIRAGIAICRPALCFFENVEGHISMGLQDVVRDLGELGYRTTWGIFSAAEVGAPHQRKRVFILAYRDGAGLQGIAPQCVDALGREEPMRPATDSRRNGEGRSVAYAVCDGSREGGTVRPGSDGSEPVCNGAERRDVWPSRPGEPQHGWEPPRVVNSKKRRDGQHPPEQQGRDTAGRSGEAVADSQGAKRWRTSDQNDRWGRIAEVGGPDGADGQDRQIEPALGRSFDEPSGGLDYAELCVTCDNRTDELRLLGNGVVPACAAKAFATLLEELMA